MTRIREEEVVDLGRHCIAVVHPVCSVRMLCLLRPVQSAVKSAGDVGDDVSRNWQLCREMAPLQLMSQVERRITPVRRLS